MTKEIKPGSAEAIEQSTLNPREIASELITMLESSPGQTLDLEEFFASLEVLSEIHSTTTDSEMKQNLRILFEHWNGFNEVLEKIAYRS